MERTPWDFPPGLLSLCPTQYAAATTLTEHKLSPEVMKSLRGRMYGRYYGYKASTP